MQETARRAAASDKQARFQAWLNRRYPEFASDRIEMIKRLGAQGDVVPFRLGEQQFFIVNDLDAIRDVMVTKTDIFVKERAIELAALVLGKGLITSDGDLHFRQRRMMQPAFHKERIMEYARHMCNFADEMVNDWRDGEVRDLDREMMRVTLRVVAKTLLDTDIDSDSHKLSRALTTILETYHLLMLPFGEMLDLLDEGQRTAFDEALTILNDQIYAIIAERHRDGRDRGDLLSMMLDARDVDDDLGMSDTQIRDETMTLFLSGHETTANALTWANYLLSQHPDKREKLYAEVDRVLNGRPPEPGDVPELKYAYSVFAEALRLYPPVWASPRLASKDMKLAGVDIPKGSVVMCSQFLTHRDPRYWPDAEEFIPERWDTMSIQEATHKCIYYPFAGGPRKCLGEHFAWAEGVLILAAIARKWRLELAPDQAVGMQGLITLRPKSGMRMIVTSRSGVDD